MKTNYTILKIFLLSLFILVVSGVDAQPRQNAEEMMQKYEYSEAIETYQEYFKAHAATPKEIRNITYCYMQINDAKSAVSWLEKLINTNDVTTEDVMIYADLLKSEGKYSEAIVQYEKYKTLVPYGSEIADEKIQSTTDAISWTDEPDFFVIKNEGKFNSDKSDFGLIAFGDNFYITSDRIPKNKSSVKNNVYGWTGNPYLKLYEVKMDKTDVKEIDFIKDLNDQFHNGPSVFADNNSKIYFTRTKTVKKKQKTTNPDPTSWFKENEADIYTNRLEIYSAKFINGKWDEITPFENNNAAIYSTGHPALSPDENILYFVSDMPDGFGETDIYYCEKNSDGSWGTPQNAGDKINTPGKEVFPFVDKNGVLYFSSDGLPGMGGLDLFKSNGSKNSWLEPENLKYPLNSSKDDFSIFVVESDSIGYFSSNRYGGLGSDDIYSFVYSLPPVPTELILVVNTYERMEDGTIVDLEGVDVHYHINGENNLISAEKLSPARYMTTLDCDAKYVVNGTKEGYFTHSYDFETVCETMHDTVYAQLISEKIVVNKAIVISNIYYDYDKWNIRPDAASELDKIVNLLVENPSITIELGSHTDSRGSDEYNHNLSQRRAESAVQYIIGNNVDKNRVTAKVYGESVLVNKCSNGVQCSEADHQMNRRTEFKVTGFSKDQPVIDSAEN
jgi:outer membrane protein OmpA-like peptidoglycan-associated protein/tetratricopeptide (TPR) repeat protein